MIACIGWLLNRCILNLDAFFAARDVGLIGTWILFCCIGFFFLVFVLLVGIIVTFMGIGIYSCISTAYKEARQRASAYTPIEVNNQPEIELSDKT